ncbi:MAG: two-component hybrid sensor and regulator, partial [Verrucomicrobiales bacterium]|nr:two-component hybrid sensor and regulator [Verrucomicrobiales bacterium]
TVTAVKGQYLEIVFNLWWSGNVLRKELERILIKNLVLENFEMEIEPRHLGKRTILVNARRLSDKENLPPLILVAVEDITVRKQSEEQLRRTNEELEKRVQVRTHALQESHGQMQSFCYSIAHDLRAPLRAIQGLTKAMVDDHLPDLDPEGKDYADRIVAAARRMDQLINDLLDYGRLTTAELPIKAVDTEQVFEKVQLILRDELKDKKAQIVKGEKLPVVRGNGLIVEVAFINLISNALKFVAPGVTPRIRIWSEELDGFARIHIEDNGIGIASEYRNRIFNVFERLHSDQRYPGTGIGLAIVKKGIERLGGRVGLESELDKGTRFWIELPLSSPGS